MREKHKKMCDKNKKIKAKAETSPNGVGAGRKCKYTEGGWGLLEPDEIEKLTTCIMGENAMGSRRNLSKSQICKKIKSTPLEPFQEELFKYLGAISVELTEDLKLPKKLEGLIAKQSSFHHYPNLIRIEGISRFMEAHCSLVGKKIDLVPLSCKAFEEGIKKQECRPEHKKKKSKNYQNEIIYLAKKVIKLSQSRDDFSNKIDSNNKILRKKIECTSTLINMFTSSCPKESISDINKDNEKLKNKINEIDSVLLHLSSKYPILFVDADPEKGLKGLGRSEIINNFSLIEKNKQKEFEKYFTKAKMKISSQIYESIDNMCDPNKTGIGKLLSMKNLTSSVLSDERWGHFKFAHNCLKDSLRNPLKEIMSVGSVLGCIAGVMGPQALAIGGICTAYFTAEAYTDYQQEKENIKKIYKCRSAGDAVCSEEEVKNQQKKLEDALFNLKLTIVTLPLELTGVNKLYKIIKLKRASKLSTEEGIQLIKHIDEELKAIRELSKTNKVTANERLSKLTKRIKHSPNKIFFQQAINNSNLSPQMLDNIYEELSKRGIVEDFLKLTKHRDVGDEFYPFIHKALKANDAEEIAHLNNILTKVKNGERIPKSSLYPASGKTDIILDSNALIAISKRKKNILNGLPWDTGLQQGEKKILAYLDQNPALRKRSTLLSKKHEVGNIGDDLAPISMTHRRQDDEYIALYRKLREAKDKNGKPINIGGPSKPKITIGSEGKVKRGKSGKKDQFILADIFFTRTRKGALPTFLTGDKNICKKLFKLKYGESPNSKFLKRFATKENPNPQTLAEAFPNGFEVTVNNRTIKVLLIPGK